ncbi:hypothetical protein [Dongia sp.]|uniref:hypothetical protein n=1 Tax=Dongia sp. TaxID=1977262 RepID=UPI003753889F
MTRRRLLLAGAVLILLFSGSAGATQLCSESVARERLAQLRQALTRPEAMAAIDSAKADFAVDGDYDNLRNARVLAAAKLYFKLESQLDAGDVAEACLLLGQGRSLIDGVVSGK